MRKGEKELLSGIFGQLKEATETLLRLHDENPELFEDDDE